MNKTFELMHQVCHEVRLATRSPRVACLRYLTRQLLFRDHSVTLRDDFEVVQRAMADESGCMKRRPSITMCIPARNEAATVGAVVRRIRRSLVDRESCIDEVIVVDDHSEDATAREASRAGARVVSTSSYGADLVTRGGKGDALWVGLRECRTELIGFVDADLTRLRPSALWNLFVPLIDDSRVQLVKGFVTRVVDERTVEEGRVTALTARPLLSLLQPLAATVREPLGGMFAGRTDELGSLWLDSDYGVDVGILLDIIERHGRDAVVDVPLGRITHRNRPLAELSLTATQVARAILARSRSSAVVSLDLQCRRPPALHRLDHPHVVRLRDDAGV
jgi:glucosyl-3-phosphoglycerate synthase